MSQINIISPHQDDAPLSLSQSMKGLLSAGNKLRMISCFTISSWAPQLAGKLTIEEISALRRREDEAFIAKCAPDIELQSLGFRDAPLRDDWSIKDRDEVRRAFGPTSDLVQRLAVALKPYDSDGCIWVAPLAIGHRDHLASLWATASIACDRPLIIYEDVPYSLKLTNEELAAQLESLGTMLGRLFTPVYFPQWAPLSSWMEGLSCYASQFSLREIQLYVEQIRARGGERIWMDQGALQSLFAARSTRLSLRATLHE